MKTRRKKIYPYNQVRGIIAWNYNNNNNAFKIQGKKTPYKQ